MSTTLAAPRFSRPAPATGRAIHLSSKTGSGDYFDGAAFARDSDFGAWSTPRALDHLFTSAIRALTIARIRREAINNAYLSGLVLKYPEAVGHTALRSRTSVKAYNLRKERWWFRGTRRLTINGWSLRRVERVGAIELLCAGEYFLVKLASGRVQLVASEYCGSPTGLADDSAEVNGIVYDPATRTPVAYRFGRMTRWGTVQFSGGPEELVPAAAVIHVFDPFQVLQGRGLPGSSPRSSPRATSTRSPAARPSRSRTSPRSPASSRSRPPPSFSAASAYPKPQAPTRPSRPPTPPPIACPPRTTSSSSARACSSPSSPARRSTRS